MSPKKIEKKKMAKRSTMLSEINASLYVLAAHLSQYVVALREAAAKAEIRGA